MSQIQKKLFLSGVLLCGLPMASGMVFAAKPINLAHQPISLLHSLIASPASAVNALTVKEVNRSVDINQTMHVRIQEMYAGYPVWAGDAVIHVPHGEKTPKSLKGMVSAAATQQGFMNGTIYQNLDADLANVSPSLFSQAQAQKIMQQTMDHYQRQVSKGSTISNGRHDVIVYMDANDKAHWAYKITFDVKPANTSITPSRPVYIVDAVSSQIYKQWDDIKTIAQRSDVPGGGWGGNKKMGKLVYDGLKDDLAKLEMTRDEEKSICYLKNADVTVRKYNSTDSAMSFECKSTDKDHNDIYWDADFDAVNDGYSPANDALSAGIVIKHMYQDWYGVPVLTNSDGSPMMLEMVVHVPNYDNAYWDGKQMTFGDGYSMFYPLTSLGVGAHEISHGFTEQHSNLVYSGQSGGMNEAFSDMAAQAAEFYSYGKNSWQIGPEIFKAENEALRYMDQPSKDCGGKQPGSWCSIDDATQYNDGMDPHFSSGVYNRFFYLLGTTEGWDAKKAFDVMVQANAHYWTSGATYSSGACGVISATRDLKFNEEDVKKAFDEVKVSYKDC